MFLVQRIKKTISISKDYKIREFMVDRKKVYLVFNEVLCSTTMINDFILDDLIRLSKRQLKNVESHLPDANVIGIEEKDIFSFVNQGFAVLITDKLYAIEVRERLDRGVTSVQSELSITGPKDSFTEMFNTNLGLIRRRIKTTNLESLDLEVGRYTKTKVTILSVKGIVKEELVQKVYDQLKRISIDGIIDSSYLKSYLEGDHTLFPTVMMSERPDRASMALLEGKVVILTDLSPYALILPSFFLDYFHTVDDYYQKNSNTTFIRIIRVIAFFVAIFLPAIYISVTTRNYDLVPYRLLLILKAGRTFVPFAAYIEALFMIIAFEILKESDIRMSATTGSAVSILGGLILGDAAVSAGIVSPIMIIIIAISSIAALIFPSNELVNAIRFYKISILLLSAFFGIYGVFVGVVFLFYKLISMKSFGFSYLSPIIPFDKYEWKDSILRKEQKTKYRNSYITDNVVRGRNL
ncbi:MAG TPA: spore germination protein [Candidatus Faecimonas intestinavium]|nr:spore germination protein [Candidatus Faecimonas intestinavium]